MLGATDGPNPVHPPGYPLWIALGVAGKVLLKWDPYTSFKLAATLASIAEPILFVPLAARWIGARAAWWLALLLGCSPLYWFHSVTALTYTAGSAFATAVAFLCDSALKSPAPRGADRRLLAAALLCGIGTGVRPDLPLWVGPLLLWCARSATPVGRVRAISLMLILIGGWAVLIRFGLYGSGVDSSGALAHTGRMLLATSVFQLGLWDGLLRNGVKTAAYLVWTLGMAALVAPWLWWTAARDLCRHRRDDAMFLLIWLLPALLFNLLIHMTEPGHAIWHLAPLWLLLGVGVASKWPRRATAVLCGGVICATAQFWFYPWRPNPAAPFAKRLIDAKVGYMSRTGLRQIDRRDEIHQPGDFWRTRAHDLPD